MKTVRDILEEFETTSFKLGRKGVGRWGTDEVLIQALKEIDAVYKSKELESLDEEMIYKIVKQEWCKYLPDKSSIDIAHAICKKFGTKKSEALEEIRAYHKSKECEWYNKGLEAGKNIAEREFKSKVPKKKDETDPDNTETWEAGWNDCVVDFHKEG